MQRVSRKSDTLQRIVNAACKEFAEKGMDAARIESIARHAGVTKQLVHHYFPSKDDLYRLAFDLEAQAVLALFVEDDYDQGSPTDGIKRLISRIVDVHVQNPRMASWTLDQALHGASHIDSRTSFVPITREFISQVFEPLLRRGVQTGEFRAGVDPTLFYATMFHVASACFLMGPAMTRTIGMEFDTPEGIDAWRQYATDFVLASLRAV